MKLPTPRRSNVAGHSYDTATKELTVTFHNGRSYRYPGVPLKKASTFANAESQGGYLHQHIIPHHNGTEIFGDDG